MPTVVVLYQLSVIAVSLLPDDTSSDFNDLGKKLLEGFVVAVVVAIAFTFIRLRLRDKKPPEQFISITSEKRRR
jgi:hypothetical protein